MTRLITLTTDFGHRDHYVGVMKGVILGIAPAAVIVDVCHEIPPQDIPRGAFELTCAAPYFPAGAVHLAVVDPGVGTARRAIVLAGPDAFFVGPDNGLFSGVLRRAGGVARHGRFALPRGWRAYEIDYGRHALPALSSTFHGRDVFAPVAARIATGLPASEVGSEIASVCDLPGRPAGPHVQAIDRFGNLVTSVPFETGYDYRAAVNGTTISRQVRTYGDSPGLILLRGSSGFLEIALSGGSAAEALGAAAGQSFSLELVPHDP